jgi:hypothetical protein
MSEFSDASEGLFPVDFGMNFNDQDANLSSILEALRLPVSNEFLTRQSAMSG